MVSGLGTAGMMTMVTIIITGKSGIRQPDSGRIIELISFSEERVRTHLSGCVVEKLCQSGGNHGQKPRRTGWWALVRPHWVAMVGFKHFPRVKVTRPPTEDASGHSSLN